MIPMPVFSIIDVILNLYKWVVIIMVIMSWLLGFQCHQQAQSICGHGLAHAGVFD